MYIEMLYFNLKFMYIYYTKSIERYNDNDINFGNIEVYEQLSKEEKLKNGKSSMLKKD